MLGFGPMSEKQIEKSAKLLSNPYAQPDVRMKEMQRLLEDGSNAAILGLLKRFTANADGSIADEDEKKWLEDTLVDLGGNAREPLQSYIGSQQRLTYPLRAYRRIEGEDKARSYFLDVLDQHGPLSHRASEAKLQLILQVAEMNPDGAALSRLVPYLLDHSDDVCWSVLELLEKAQTDGSLDAEAEKQMAESLDELVTEEETGPRIARRSAEILAKTEWPLGPGGELHSQLKEDFFLDKKRIVRRRSRKAGS